MCLPLKTFRDFPQSTLQGQVPTPLGSATLGRPIFPSSSPTFSCPMGFGFFFKHRIYCIKPYLGPQSTSAVRAERGVPLSQFLPHPQGCLSGGEGPRSPGETYPSWSSMLQAHHPVSVPCMNQLPHASSTPPVPPETPFSLLPSHQSLDAKKFLV